MSDDNDSKARRTQGREQISVFLSSTSGVVTLLVVAVVGVLGALLALLGA